MSEFGVNSSTATTDAVVGADDNVGVVVCWALRSDGVSGCAYAVRNVSECDVVDRASLSWGIWLLQMLLNNNNINNTNVNGSNSTNCSRSIIKYSNNHNHNNSNNNSNNSSNSSVCTGAVTEERVVDVYGNVFVSLVQTLRYSNCNSNTKRSIIHTLIHILTHPQQLLQRQIQQQRQQQQQQQLQQQQQQREVVCGGDSICSVFDVVKAIQYLCRRDSYLVKRSRAVANVHSQSVTYSLSLSLSLSLAHSFAHSLTHSLIRL